MSTNPAIMEQKVNPESLAYREPKEEGVLDTYSRRTTVHGLHYVFSPEVGTIRRVIWAILLLVPLFLFFSLTYEIMVKYLAWPVDIQTRAVRGATVPFPAITICSQSPLKLTSLANSGNYASIKTVYPTIKNWGNAISVANLNVSEVAVTSGPVLSNLVLSCRYGSHVCTSADWSSRMMSLGQCHTFTPPSSQAAPGDHGGLTLVLNSEAYDVTYELGGAPGIKILVHGATDLPLLGENSISISPGFDLIGQLSLLDAKRLGAPYSDCGSNVDSTERSCQVACMVQDTKASCKCAPFYDIGSGESVCSTATQLNCSRQTIYKFLTTGVISTPCSCSVPCDEKVFSTQTMFSMLSETVLSNTLSSAIKSNMATAFSQAQAAVSSTGAPALPTNLTYSDNIINVELFFKSLVYTEEVHSIAYSFNEHAWDHFVSLLICFGMSLVTWFELVDLAIVACARCCRKI